MLSDPPFGTALHWREGVLLTDCTLTEKTMKSTRSQLLEAALDITGAACPIPLKAFHEPMLIDIKADESPVTQADRATEKQIRAALNAQFPEDGIYGEEFGCDGLDRRRIWVIDPIDGTKSFILGLPLFGMLLSLMEDGENVLGVVRLPALDQVFAGGRGLAATKNGHPIRASGCRSMAEARLFINEPEKIFAADPALFGRLATGGAMRRMGYDCLSHMLIAEGRLDALLDYDLKPYDYLPFAAVIEAAGGVMTDWEGRRLDFNSDGRVACSATPELHAELLDFLNR